LNAGLGNLSRFTAKSRREQRSALALAGGGWDKARLRVAQTVRGCAGTFTFRAGTPIERPAQPGIWVMAEER
jgi:hypothetical protein